ncbi:VOC family protein [Neisseriaceae bacterium PsAf]|nr:VOC family protein [Neisseriaceae bacterium PsAf]
MKTGFEINFVVKNVHEALALYTQIFEVNVIEKTNFQLGSNEVVFSIYGQRIHLLDENPEFGLKTPNEPMTGLWFNVIVPEIKTTFQAALGVGCEAIMPITDMPKMGVSNAVFRDPFGYQWMLHQVHKVLSFEEREQIFKEMGVN